MPSLLRHYTPIRSFQPTQFRCLEIAPFGQAAYFTSLPYAYALTTSALHSHPVVSAYAISLLGFSSLSGKRFISLPLSFTFALIYSSFGLRPHSTENPLSWICSLHNPSAPLQKPDGFLHVAGLLLLRRSAYASACANPLLKS